MTTGRCHTRETVCPPQCQKEPRVSAVHYTAEGASFRLVAPALKILSCHKHQLHAVSSAPVLLIRGLSDTSTQVAYNYNL